jgi:uncharacterized membrane protein
MTLQRRHIIFYISALAGAAAFLVGLLFFPDLASTIGANAFFVVYLGLTLHAMPHLTAAFLSKSAAETDEPVAIIFLVTVAVVGVAISSLFLLINAGQRPEAFHLVFSLASVPLGWFAIHTMAALHYAHAYWQGGSGATKAARKPLRGLAFPGTESPEGWDFLYYSMVVGMTAQTADTNITDTRMRRITMVHSVFSFFFNTVIVAAAVNLVVTIANQS